MAMRTRAKGKSQSANRRAATHQIVKVVIPRRPDLDRFKPANKRLLKAASRRHDDDGHHRLDAHLSDGQQADPEGPTPPKKIREVHRAASGPRPSLPESAASPQAHDEGHSREEEELPGLSDLYEPHLTKPTGSQTSPETSEEGTRRQFFRADLLFSKRNVD
ncbi:hypothetical protein PCANC_23792 [Puccinia coronata f. sp. avenae]|uniref:Uncharacterized protein n=1 Tax=Puccinia coronata f. sp. avenae TaxID=200324 RepID=A0A2N5TLG5_9BASI|nr:hypothetical protein PCASD_15912 [Puccinia coronata f. sp. avenae]PLW26304.1 hypothetical protein PCANC_23792 [Puccinia coronata f. sp. avenae]PLW48840.1 hypothetical protein PCASD_02839 [Puccinia coronata f. sp. avenae]